MVAGAIGVGVAYPLDTLKTKMQACGGGSPWETARRVLATDGPSGFYGGVASTMLGQAVIKGVLFFAYDLVMSLLTGGRAPSTPDLLLSAAASGAVASFFVTPIERVKVVMQASAAADFASPLACINTVLQSDGIAGFCFRGLGATLAREVPAYTLYFVAYEGAKAALLSSAPSLPAGLVPLLGGAAAGVASWVPVYPVDVVKTNLQTSTDAGRGESFASCARRLYRTGGLGVFWEGLLPKVLRAVINHATTFYVFELLCDSFG